MLESALAILGLGALCGGWILFQRWIARMDPGAPGIRRSCRGHLCDGDCGAESPEGPTSPPLDAPARSA
jgi:hypothetical protein